ncbi:CsbD family protein [Streptosporangium sp. NPDC050855]|uniref:CsbD family protein n=1 Tax=Streptosporangium sp. NPDC050855 TaxID=3366194 RepID=UPI0037BB1486
MGTDDKISNKAEELGGKLKEGAGRATGDERLEAEGRTDQSESHLKQAGEKVKDGAEKVKDAFKS